MIDISWDLIGALCFSGVLGFKIGIQDWDSRFGCKTIKVTLRLPTVSYLFRLRSRPPHSCSFVPYRFASYDVRLLKPSALALSSAEHKGLTDKREIVIT
jgi:hypothetical protein